MYLKKSYTCTVDSYVNIYSFMASATSRSFKISPSLPAGLHISKWSGRIYGIPKEISPSQTYTVKYGVRSVKINISVLAVITGYVLLGAVKYADVDVHDTDGNLIASGTTDSNGKYTISISNAKADDIFLVAAQGTDIAQYTDEASGKLVKYPEGNTLLAVAQIGSEVTVVYVTAASTLATFFTGIQVGSSSEESKVKTAAALNGFASGASYTEYVSWIAQLLGKPSTYPLYSGNLDTVNVGIADYAVGSTDIDIAAAQSKIANDSGMSSHTHVKKVLSDMSESAKGIPTPGTAKLSEKLSAKVVGALKPREVVEGAPATPATVPAAGEPAAGAPAPTAPGAKEPPAAGAPAPTAPGAKELEVVAAPGGATAGAPTAGGTTAPAPAGGATAGAPTAGGTTAPTAAPAPTAPTAGGTTAPAPAPTAPGAPGAPGGAAAPGAKESEKEPAGAPAPAGAKEPPATGGAPGAKEPAGGAAAGAPPAEAKESAKEAPPDLKADSKADSKAEADSNPPAAAK